jgi:hypothetical protein
MSEKTTSGSDQPPPPVPCPICGALNHPAGFHDNLVDNPAGFHDNAAEKQDSSTS